MAELPPSSFENLGSDVLNERIAARDEAVKPKKRAAAPKQEKQQAKSM